MPVNNRLMQIQSMVKERRYLSVSDLSRYFQVSEMTIRRDLHRLNKEGLVQRTYGGVKALEPTLDRNDQTKKNSLTDSSNELLANRVDVIITSSMEKRFDDLLLDRAAKKNIPIIAESAPLDKEASLVALDNYKAGFELGRWAGIEATNRWKDQINILDLTFSMPNTQVRSQAFLNGMREICPNAVLTLSLSLSLDADSDVDMSYQHTRDALTVHPEVNVIFAVNDATAWGAICACRDLSIDPKQIVLFTFGLEGNTMRDALAAGIYCKAGLAMFPEIVAPVCIEAAIAAYNHTPIPDQLITPHTILTSENIGEIYQHTPAGWIPRWDKIYERFTIPLDIYFSEEQEPSIVPCRIGFIVPFSTHEWYQNLVYFMREYAKRRHIELEIVDAEKDIHSEIEARRRAIAFLAAKQVEPNNVIILDNGPIANYLAEELLGKSDVTVITNSISVFQILLQDPKITLISTGGALRRSSQVLVGPTAEGALHELRADILFLSVTGINLEFGLSHTNFSEVSIKQAMIRSAHEVVLIADYTNFGQESVAQVAKIESIHKLITDGSLPANMRLELAKLGIKVLVTNE
jgi:DeoR/GlpR family transcriptional regulator of sugar metabolism